jgi:hypothetical protein
MKGSIIERILDGSLKGINMRIFYNNTYIGIMKTRLNITIDESLLAEIKAYASSKHISISELAENYFKNIKRPAKRKNIIQLVEKSEKPQIVTNTDLKELYYTDRAKKYGF